MTDEQETKRAYIQKTYAQVAQNSTIGGGCCSSGCSCGGNSSISPVLGYTAAQLADLPGTADLGLGCGNPVDAAMIQLGEVILDLGSGGGIDCFIARTRTGETGHVIGVDMTPEMIALAQNHLQEKGYDNVEFRLGEIEQLPVADSSIDVIISNCVINLSQNKQQVFHEVFRVLKPGGRVAISDILTTAELPDEIKQDLTLLAGCVAGAQHVKEIEAMLVEAGFSSIELIPKDASRTILETWVPGADLAAYAASYLITAVKLPQ